MVAIVSGASLGLFDSSLSHANGLGQVGSGSSYVNLATGNLVLQFSDETLSGSGADIRHTRTYNSLGQHTDGDNDRWRWLGEKRVRLVGELNQVGSQLVRTTGDGNEAIYVWDAAQNKYSSSAGTGANDTLWRSGNEWVWQEGSSKVVERYHVTTGWIKTLRDPSGNGFNYTFNGDRLTKVTDIRSGQTLEMAYHNGRLSRVDTLDTILGPDGKKATHKRRQQVSYEHDSLGRLVKVKANLDLGKSLANPATSFYTTSYSYVGSSHLIQSMTQDDGTSVQYTYQKVNGVDVVKTVSDQSGTTIFHYLSDRTEVVNGAGQKTVYVYDSKKRVKEVIYSDGNGQSQSMTYLYDKQDNVIRTEDALGKRTHYAYDEQSNLIRMVSPSGQKTERTYANNLLVTETTYVKDQPETTRYVYDGAQRLRYVISAEGRVSQSRYITGGLLVKQINYGKHSYQVNNLAKTDTLTLTQLDNWVKRITDHSANEVTDYAYDHNGNLRRTFKYGGINPTSGNGYWSHTAVITDYVYNAYGQLLNTYEETGTLIPVDQREPSLRTTRTKIEGRTYDGMGRLVSVSNANGTVTTSYGNRVIQSIHDKTGVTSTQSFDARGRLIAKTRSAGAVKRVQEYVYDDAGRLASTLDATGARSFTLYNPAGLVAYQVDAGGSVTGFLYDERGLVKEKRRYATQVNTSSWPDVRNSLALATSSDDRVTHYAYRADGKLSRQQEVLDATRNRVTLYSYDTEGKLTATQQSSLITRYFYDKDGLLIGELNAERYLTFNIYDAAGRKIRVVRYAQQVANDTRKTGDFNKIRTEVMNSAKLQSYYFYDGQGRQIARVNEQGYLSDTLYEPANLLKIERRFKNVVTVSSTDTLNAIRSRAGSALVARTHFRVDGKVDKTVAHDGTIARYHYDQAGRVVKTVNAAGHQEQTAVRTRYNAFGEVTGVVSGEGEAKQTDLNTAITQYGTTYAFDAMGRKISESGPEGQKTWFFYNKEGLLTYQVNALGEVTTFTYNAFDQVASQRLLNKRISTTGLSGGSETTTLIDRVNQAKDNTQDSETRTLYNRLGLTRSTFDGEGHETKYGYDSLGRLNNIYRPLDDTRTTREYIQYDLLNRVTQRHQDWTGFKARQVTQYDGFGRVIKTVDANNNATSYRYLQNGRQLEVTDALGRKVTSNYDFMGRTIQVTNAKGHVAKTFYDDKHRKITQQSFNGFQTSVWQDRLGRTVKTQDGRGGIRTQQYNRDGQLAWSKDASGYQTTYRYDASQRLKQVVDAAGRVQEYEYDKANRQTLHSLDPTGLNLRTRYDYNGRGLQRSVTEASGTSVARSTYFEYDRNGRVLTQTLDRFKHGSDVKKVMTRYEYNHAGQVVKEKQGTFANPDQRVKEFYYDKLGRLYKEVLSPGNLDITTQYRYDLNGNLTRKIDANGRNTWYGYDRANQKIFEINAAGYVTRYAYDANGQLAHTRQYHNKTSLTGLGNVVTSIATQGDNAQDRRTYFVYDKDGRQRFTLKSVNQNNWKATETIYDRNNNIFERRQYDNYVGTGAVNKIIAGSSEENGRISQTEMAWALQQAGYKNKSWGDDTSNIHGLSTRTFYSYNANNQLRFTIDALGFVTENVYDRVGNLRFVREYADRQTGHLKGDFSEANMIASLVKNGPEDRVTQYRYDSANRLVEELKPWSSIARSDGTAIGGHLKTVNTYDALGQLRKREEGIIDRGTEILHSEKRTTTFEYDNVGNQVKTTLSGWYDMNDGRVYQSRAGQSDRFQRSITTKYDDLGNAILNWTRVGLNDYVSQHKLYDNIGRELYSVDGMGIVTGKTYDKMSNVLTETRYSKNLRSLIADGGTASGGSSSYGAPGTSGSAYGAPASSYNPYQGQSAANYREPSVYLTHARLENAIANDNARRTISHQYDVLNRKHKTVFPSIGGNFESSGDRNVNFSSSKTLYTASPETRYHYNAFNEIRLVQKKINNASANGFWNNHFTFYDQLGRKTYDVDGMRYFTQYQYDASGNLKTKVEYADATGSDLNKQAPTHIANNNNRITDYAYDRKGQLLSTTLRHVGHVTRKTHNTWSAATRGDIVQSRQRYNAFGEVYESSDALGNKTTYHYNRLGLVYRVTEPKRWVAHNKLNAFEGVHATPYTHFKYDAFGNITSKAHSTDVGRGGYIAEQFQYDNAGNQIQHTDQEGTHATFKYDVAGRVIEQSKIARVTTGLRYHHAVKSQFVYDKAGRQTYELQFFDGKKAGTRNTYNSFGEVTEEAQVWGDASTANHGLNDAITSTYLYDKFGRMTQKRDGSGYTHFYYDLVGNVTRTEARGDDNSTSQMQITERFYDRLGRVLLERQPLFWGTKADGSKANLFPKIAQRYDRWGNVTQRIDAAGFSTFYAYNQRNQLVKETSTSVSLYKPNDKNRYIGFVEKHHIYDKQGNQAITQYRAIEKSTGNRVQLKTSYQFFDVLGRTTLQIDSTGKSQRMIYDVHGNKVGVNRGGVVSLYDYNKRGELTRESVIRNGNRKVLKTYEYDSLGRRYEEKNAAGDKILYKYDQRGNIVLKSDINNQQTRYVYDDLGNKKAEEKSEFHEFTRTETVTVPADPNASYGSPSSGSSSGSSYGSPSSGGSSGSSAPSTGSGFVTKKITLTDSFQFWVGDKWDYRNSDYKVGQLTRRRYVSGVNRNGASHASISYQYDRFGRVSKEISRGTISYVYHNNGQIKSKTDVQTFGTKQRRMVAEYHTDIRGLVTEERHSLDDRTRGTDGDYSRIVNAWMTKTFSYDALGRLKKVVAPNKKLYSDAGNKEGVKLNHLYYEYDAWGNRRVTGTSYQLNGATTASGKGRHLYFDNEGRVTKEEYEGKIKHYTYNSRGLKSTETVATKNGSSPTTQSQFFYDDQGRLVQVNRKDTPSSAYQRVEFNRFNDRGHKTQAIIEGVKTDTAYHKDGRIQSQTTYEKNSSKVARKTDNYVYNQGGRLTSYKLHSGGVVNTYHYAYERTAEGEKTKTIRVSSTQGNTKSGSTHNYYDHRGRLISSKFTEANKKGDSVGNSIKLFAYSVDSQIFASLYKKYGESGIKVQNHYQRGNTTLADMGDDGIHIDAIDTFQNGGDTPGRHTVNAGETLASIAQSHFGDASLWYVLADANGLAMGPSQAFSHSYAGRELIIPNSSKVAGNTAASFRSYNSGEILGELTPSVGIVPPPKPDKCKQITAIIVVAVVAAAATVITAGAAAPVMGTVFGTTTAAGATVASASTAAFIAAGATTGLIAGLAGSVAGQAAAIGLTKSRYANLQQGFDWKGFAAAGIAGALTGGVGGVFGKLGTQSSEIAKILSSKHVSTTVKASASYLSTKASNTVVNAISTNVFKGDALAKPNGLSSFTWRDMLAKVGASAITPNFGQTDSLLRHATSEFSTLAATQAANNIFHGDSLKKDLGSKFANAFGNTIGNLIAYEVKVGAELKAFNKEMKHKLLTASEGDALAAFSEEDVAEIYNFVKRMRRAGRLLGSGKLIKVNKGESRTAPSTTDPRVLEARLNQRKLEHDIESHLNITDDRYSALVLSGNFAKDAAAFFAHSGAFIKGETAQIALTDISNGARYIRMDNIIKEGEFGAAAFLEMETSLKHFKINSYADLGKAGDIYGEFLKSTSPVGLVANAVRYYEVLFGKNSADMPKSMKTGTGIEAGFEALGVVLAGAKGPVRLSRLSNINLQRPNIGELYRNLLHPIPKDVIRGPQGPSSFIMDEKLSSVKTIFPEQYPTPVRHETITLRELSDQGLTQYMRRWNILDSAPDRDALLLKHGDKRFYKTIDAHGGLVRNPAFFRDKFETFVVPEGRSATVFATRGSLLDGQLGYMIQEGQSLEHIYKRTYHAGERMPEMEFTNFEGRVGDYFSVGEPVRLSTILNSSDGHWNISACRACRETSKSAGYRHYFNVDGAIEELYNPNSNNFYDSGSGIFY